MPRRRISPNQLSLFNLIQRPLFEAASAPISTPPQADAWMVIAERHRCTRVLCYLAPPGTLHPHTANWARPNGGREFRVAHRFENVEEAQATAERYQHFRARVAPFGQWPALEGKGKP